MEELDNKKRIRLSKERKRIEEKRTIETCEQKITRLENNKKRVAEMRMKEQKSRRK